MKCSCKSGCCGNIRFSSGDHGIWIVHEKAPQEMLIYVDANALVELIKEAKECLMEMTHDR